MAINIYVQPGETISQALCRVFVDLKTEGKLPITIPQGASIHSTDELRRVRFIDKRKTGIPFLKTSGR